MNKRQEQNFQELQENLLSFDQENKEELSRVMNYYDKKIENLEADLGQTQANYEKNAKDIAETIEEKDNKNNLKLEALRQELSASKRDISNVVQKVVKSSVSITTEKDRGSGAVLTSDGYIVTNNHVLKGADSITAIDYYGRVSEASLVARDPVRDLAILKISKSFDDYFRLGNSDNIKVGEAVIAIGSPKGLDFTVTQGIISAAKRIFSEDEGAFIQTDVPINTGSSGGPLVNMDGRLIGINTFKLKGTENLGFSIPSNDVRVLLEQALNAE